MVIPIERSPSNSSSKQSQQAFCVRATYRYDGRPNPPELPVLMFNEGDLIQVKYFFFVLIKLSWMSTLMSRKA